MNYISINLYRKMINHAIYEGMTRDDFIDLPTPIDSIDNIQVVPANQFFEFHEILDKELGPGFSVRIGQQMKMEDYGVLGLSWKTCSWAGEIFDRSERYFKLLSNTYFFKVEKDNGISRVLLNREAYRRGMELSNEATLSATVVVLLAITESDISPVEVSFKHAPPEKLDDYKKAFNCPILFNQPQNYIAYKTEDLNMRTAKADESDCSGDKHQSLPKRESMYKAMKFQKETYQDVVSPSFSSEGQVIYQPLITFLMNPFSINRSL